MLSLKSWVVGLFIFSTGIAHALPLTYVRNYKALRDALGYAKYDTSRAENIGLAILDPGFGGPEEGETFSDYLNKYIPREFTTLISHYEEGSFCNDKAAPALTAAGDNAADRGTLDLRSNHGLLLAQVAYSLFNLPVTKSPKFFLFNAHGTRNFKMACKCLVKLAKRLGTPVMKNLDRLVVDHSQNFEFGNFNGRGDELNEAVTEVIEANPLRPVIWVNAVGNYHRHVKNALVRADANGWAILDAKNNKNFLEFRINTPNPAVKVTLSWNSFGKGLTKKDLDLYIKDPSGQQLDIESKPGPGGDKALTRWAGRFVQTDVNDDSNQLASLGGPDDPAPVVHEGPGLKNNETNLAREYIVIPKVQQTFGNETYKIFVHVKTPALFNPRVDRLRVTITTPRDRYFNEETKKYEEPVELLNHDGKMEVASPADHPKVLATGDRGVMSALGPTADGRVKPDFLVENNDFTFNDNRQFGMSSSTAAMLAANIVLMLGVNPNLTVEQIREMGRKEMPYVPLDHPYAPPVYDVAWATAQKSFPEIFDKLIKIYGKENLQPWQLDLPSPHNRVVVGVKGEVNKLASLVQADRTAQPTTRYQDDLMYLETRADGSVVAFKRRTDKIEGRDVEIAPWAISDGRKTIPLPASFVFVRPALPENTPRLVVWRNPDPEKLPRADVRPPKVPANAN